MKHKNSILASAGAFLLVLSLVPSAGRAANPCPPPQIDVEDGTSATTPCTMAAGTYSTNFPASENPISEGAKWINGAAVGLDWHNVQTTSGKAFGASFMGSAAPTRYSDDIAILTTSALAAAPNQFAQGTVFKAAGYAPGAQHEAELLLRFSITAHNAHGYEVLWGISGYVAVVRWNGALASYTPIYDPGSGSISVPNDGDVLRAEISGNIIKVFKNAVQVGPNVDVTSIGGTVYSTGQPGMGFWPIPGATLASYGWKNFQAGNL